MGIDYLGDVELRGLEVIDPDKFQAYVSLLGTYPEQADLGNHTVSEDGLILVFSELELFHGSATKGIVKDFLPAEDDTIGQGLYTTSSPYNASRYAINRARYTDADPVLYTVGLNDYSFVDLRTNDAVASFMPGFADYVEEYGPGIAESVTWDGGTNIFLSIFERCIVAVREGKLTRGTLKNALQQTGSIFSDYVKSQGADGIVAYEGGEFPNGTHDSWVIMRPEKAVPVAEVSFKDFVFQREMTPEEIREKEEKDAQLEARFGKPIPPYTRLDELDLR